MNIIRSYISLHLKVISLIFIFSILFSKRSSAQQNVSSLQLYNYQFDHLTFENGLSFNLVTSIIKDKREFIWIATIDGLNRYDGINFKKRSQTIFNWFEYQFLKNELMKLSKMIMTCNFLER